MKVSTGSPTTFSNDVLKIVLSGPSKEHLSIIDVPGIFRKVTAGVTSDADMKLVREMVEGYMASPRSVMLAVVPANADIANEEIIDIASRYDPNGVRTLGILTKLDLVDKGAELSVVDIIEGKREVLALGWHAVRNLGQSQLDDKTADRQTVEQQFFQKTAPWDRLDHDSVGIASLQVRLQKVLEEHVRREFPSKYSDVGYPQCEILTRCRCSSRPEQGA